MNNFKEAVRLKLRFRTDRGNLSVEDLYDLKQHQLDTLYRNLSKEKQEVSGEGLLETKTKQDEILELSLAIVKEVFEDKKADAQAVLDARSKAERKAKLLELLDKKQEEGMAQMSIDEIKKQIEELDK